MGDFFTSLGNAVSNGFKNVGDAVHGEAQKMSNRTVENVKADFDEVATGIKKGGVLGGGAAMFDVATPGHQIANLADDMDILPHDHNIKQVVAAGINFGIGAGIPGAGLFLQADALAEGFDGVSGLLKGVQLPSLPSLGGGAAPAPSTSTGSAPATDGGQAPCAPSQGNVAPSDAYKAAKERAIEIAKMKSAEKTAYMKGFLAGERYEARHEGHTQIVITDPSFRPHGGYGDPGFCPCDGINTNLGDLLGTVGKIGGGIDQVDHSIDDILNNPNMSFEDKIFFLMQNVMEKDEKNLEDEGRAMADVDNKKEAGIKAKDDEIAKMTAKNPNDPQIRIKQQERDAAAQDLNDSRSAAAQSLQQATSKLAEMQQALTAVLTSMHDNAMNTIRNIK